LGLRGFIAKRLLNTLILIVFVITVNFVIFELMPGVQGAILNLVSSPRNNQNPTEVQRLLVLYNLCTGFVDGKCVPKPVWDRFVAYFFNMLTLQFGDSFQTGNPVLHDMIQTGRLENTLLLLGISTVMSLLIGTLLGVIVARKRGTFIDSGAVTTSLVTFSLPTFWIGLVLIIVFSQNLNWFPPGSTAPAVWAFARPDLFNFVLGHTQYLFLPVLTLTLFFYGGHLLLTRASMLEVLSEDYITTARAKGVSERSIIFKHALKNAALPLITNAALSFGTILSGAIITETVFNWDGMGLWIFNSIGFKDFPVMQAIFFIVALCVIGANFISDILYGIIDPRIKYS